MPRDNPNLPSEETGPNEPTYVEITDEESNDPTYASVGVATGKYTYNITTNTSYDTVIFTTWTLMCVMTTCMLCDNYQMGNNVCCSTNYILSFIKLS